MCISVRPTRLNFTPNNPMASDLVTVTVNFVEKDICVPTIFTSKFNQAMAVYKKHFLAKVLKRAFRKTTTQDDFAPTTSARSALLLHTDVQFSPALISLLKSLPLSYKPGSLEMAGNNQSELGNSVHNIDSVAWKNLNLHGVRVFKILGVVHDILRAPRYVPRKDNTDELLWWFETVLHDLKYGRNGELGYGNLIRVYIIYLKCLLECRRISSTLSSSSTRHYFTAHQNLALSSHAFREILFLDIQASNHRRTGAKVLSLQLVVNDALDFAEREQPLLEGMRKEGVQRAIVEEKARLFEIRREEVQTFVARCGRFLYTCKEGEELKI